MHKGDVLHLNCNGIKLLELFFKKVRNSQMGWRGDINRRARSILFGMSHPFMMLYFRSYTGTGYKKYTQTNYIQVNMYRKMYTP